MNCVQKKYLETHYCFVSILHCAYLKISPVSKCGKNEVFPTCLGVLGHIFC